MGKNTNFDSELFFKKFTENFHHPIFFLSYFIDQNNMIRYQKIEVLNPEVWFQTFKDKLKKDVLKEMKEEPNLWVHVLLDTVQEKWNRALISLEKKRNLRFYFYFKNDFSSKLLLCCNLSLFDIAVEDKTKVYTAFCVVEDYKNLTLFLRLISKHSLVGIFIYRDTFKYVNLRFCKITGYKKEELYTMPIWEIAHPKIKEQIKEIVQQRLKGKIFSKFYKEAPIITKKQKIKWLQVYANTFYFKNKVYGLGMIIDKTKEKKIINRVKKLKRIYFVFSKLNESLVKNQKNNAEKIFKEILRILIQYLFDFAWVGKVHIQEKDVKPILSVSKKEDYKTYLNGLKISIDPESPFSKGPTGRAFLENKIQFNNNSKKNANVTFWKERLLKFNFNSSTSIPIETPNEKYNINLYSTKENFLKGEIIPLLQKLKLNLESVLYNQYIDEWLNIYSYVLEKANLIFFITDSNNRIIYVNPYTEKFYGYTFEELQNQDPKIFKSDNHSKEFFQKLWNTILQKEIFQEVFINKKKSGDLVYVQQSIIPIINGNKITHFVTIGFDITKRYQAIDEISSP